MEERETAVKNERKTYKKKRKNEKKQKRKKGCAYRKVEEKKMIVSGKENEGNFQVKKKNVRKRSILDEKGKMKNCRD